MATSPGNSNAAWSSPLDVPTSANADDVESQKDNESRPSPLNSMMDLAADNERLRAENARLAAEVARTALPEWPAEGEKLTLDTVAGQLKRMAIARRRAENMMEAALGSLGVTVDEDGTVQRGAPPMSSGIADQMGLMETFGMSPDQIQYAREVFELYDRDKSGTMDADECLEVLQYLGEDPTMEEVETMIAEVDINENGDLDLGEFFQIYSRIAEQQAADEEEDDKPAPKMSQYGVMALMRWVHYDGAGAVTFHRKKKTVEKNEQTGRTYVTVAAHRSFARTVVLNAYSEYFFQLAIAVSAVCSGVTTYAGYEHSTALAVLGTFSTVVFVIETALKFVAESQSCASIGGYFSDHWNTFDVVILTCLLLGEIVNRNAQAGGDVVDVRVLRVFRFLRALRVLRAAKVLPQLALVMETLLRSASAVGYIAGFMLLIAYIFGVIGVTIFKHNDPFHFGTLDRALVSLFRIVTLEDWTDIMYFNAYGCEGWGDYNRVIAHNGTTVVAEIMPPCQHEAFSFMGVMYFLVYILISSFLVLNLFIGVIVQNMTEMAEEVEEKKAEAKAWAVATRLKAHKSKTEGEGGKLSNLSSKFKGGSYSLNTHVSESAFSMSQDAKQAKKKKSSSKTSALAQISGVSTFDGPISPSAKAFDG